jgi:uncharacterized membrane protein
MKSFSISKAVGKGWKLTTSHLGFLLGVAVITVILPNFLQNLLTSDHGPSIWNGLVKIVLIIVGMVLQLGVYKISLMLIDGKKPEFKDLFEQYPKLVNYLVASILYGLGVVVGLILLVVPGIWFALRYQFYGVAIVDKNLDPIEALKYSSQITKDNTLKLLGLALTSLGILILGFLALVVGMLVAIPVIWLAVTFVYRTLSKSK